MRRRAMAEPKAQQQQRAEQVAERTELGDFQMLLNKEFKPKTDGAKNAIAVAVQTLAQQALAETTLVSDDAIRTIEAIIAEIDEKLSQQLNLILHNEDFKKLEGTWRGLHHLVTNTETDETL
jgi:type VI secretion system protein ImpC